MGFLPQHGRNGGDRLSDPKGAGPCAGKPKLQRKNNNNNNNIDTLVVPLSMVMWSGKVLRTGTNWFYGCSGSIGTWPLGVTQFLC